MEVENLVDTSARVWYWSPLMVPLLAITAGLSVYYFWDQQRRITKMGNAIPGPPTLPFLGNAHFFIGKTHNEILEFAIQLSKMYGNITRGWIGNKLVIFLTHPADVEIILNSHVYLDKSEEYRFFKPWLGEGLLISSGEKWRSHRKLIAPAFHQNILKSFVPTFNDNSLAVVDKMRTEYGKGEFDVHDYMSSVTVDILLETAMGTERTKQGNEGFDYAMAVMKMCDLIHARHFKIYYRFDKIFNFTNLRKQQEKLLGIIHGLTKAVIKRKNELYDKDMREGTLPSPILADLIAKEEEKEQKKKTTKEASKEGLRDDLDDQDENDIGEKRRMAFLDLMIETAKGGANLTDEEIKEEVDTIMFEGHDTTAAGSSFVLCQLGVHQDIQARVYEEIRGIFGDSDRPATFADTLEMKYLERVILESLRLFPPVPMIARKLNQDVQMASENHVLPAGCTVVIGTFKLHRRDDIYPNAEVFDPDNFLPERTANRHYYSFIPFSAGPRSCVGRKYAMLKLKILLSTVLRNFKINSKLTEDDYKLQADIILKRTDGFRIEIEPRQKNRFATVF